jgi:hypothetical protein
LHCERWPHITDAFKGTAWLTTLYDGMNRPTTNKVEKSFLGKAINRAGIYLYSKGNTLNFLEECRKQDIPVLGIDGFYLTESTIQPSMDNSIDFSTRSFEKEIYDEAIQFIVQRGEDLYFEVVCAE